MNIQDFVKSKINRDEFNVWRLSSHENFGYTDGRASEKYLQAVFSSVENLESDSYELESYIKDWPSEYHLSRKRYQLLSGFSFDPSSLVLEVGCGCGAITRGLAENFRRVIAVEGSINRARLARQRTKDLDSVSVLCAPFQNIEFSCKFDIIFCIGVFEYSSSFIDGADPYESALQYFSDILAPGGIIVIAIENQFGLKYFNRSREDHLGVPFEGLEGYHRTPGKVRTFGKIELEDMLKKHFSEVEFYYPFPDYKMPDCIITDGFLSDGRGGEIISQLGSRDYILPERFLWNEAAVGMELSRNRMSSFFSNSFLVFASSGGLNKKQFDQEVLMYSKGRKPSYSVETRVVRDDRGELVVKKCRKNKKEYNDGTILKLKEDESPWMDIPSLYTQVVFRACKNNGTLEEIFKPCLEWVLFLKGNSSISEGVAWVDGKYLDAIWSNAYIDNAGCRLVDQEWIWNQCIPLNVIVIRAIYDFLSRVEKTSLSVGQTRIMSGKKLINLIAKSIGISLSERDFKTFIEIEAALAEEVTGKNRLLTAFYIRWFFVNRFTRRFISWAYPVCCSYISRIVARIKSFLSVQE